jgi:AcrR family transcriptional regulator
VAKVTAGSPGGRVRRTDGAERQQHILGVAVSCFAQTGYHGTSARDIASAAKVPLSALHYYFANKEELFIAAFAMEFQRVANQRNQATQDIGKLSLADLVRGYITPLLDSGGESDNRDFLRLQSRALDDPQVAIHVFDRVVLPSTKPYLAALQNFFPKTARADLVRCFRNMTWAVGFAPIDPLYEALTDESPYPQGPRKTRALIELMVKYHTAGILAVTSPTAKA